MEKLVSPETVKLINAINEYMAATIKKSTKFTDDDYIQLTNMLAILNKHLDLLLKYENKNN